jgi:hypothetical protein
MHPAGGERDAQIFGGMGGVGIRQGVKMLKSWSDLCFHSKNSPVTI